MNTNKHTAPSMNCNGTGYLAHFAHVDGGICYPCNGEGVVEISDPLPPVAETWRPGACLDLRIEGVVFRCYAFADRAWEVTIVRPEFWTDPDDFWCVGTLWFRGARVDTSLGMRERDIAEMRIEDKRRLFAAAREVFRAASRLGAS